MLDGVKSPIGGNVEVVEMLEKYLARAKLGQICYATVTTAEEPETIAFERAGAINMEWLAEIALDQLKQRIIAGQINRLPPEPDPNKTADYACFNLSAMPSGFDFLPWLIDAEMTRRREGAPAPLKVAFYMGLNGVTGLGTPYRKRMIEGVLWPLLNLVGAVEDPSAVTGRAKPWVQYDKIAESYNRGEEVPALTPSGTARATVKNYIGDRPPVVITLREADHWPHRNSNLPDWMKFASRLQDLGEQVVFVRDTAKAFEPLEGFATWPRASVDLDMRVALYEAAKASLFVSNGPSVLSLFMRSPWLTFIPIDENDDFIPNRPEWWKANNGLDIGDQFPWSGQNQKMIWKKDTFANMVEAWEELFGRSSDVADDAGLRSARTAA